MRPNRHGYLEVRDDGVQLVGAREDDDYMGPAARVSHDDTWLHVTTDDYEGAAMLNIEALPYLILALSNIARAIGMEPLGCPSADTAADDLRARLSAMHRRAQRAEAELARIPETVRAWASPDRQREAGQSDRMMATVAKTRTRRRP